jgi:Bacterial membrane protein YfhO
MSVAVASPARERASPRPRGSRAADVVCLGVIVLCALVLHRDGLFGGPAFYEIDTRLFYFPLAQWVGQQLQTGHFPLWTAAIFTGYPIFADGEMGLAYLPQVLLLWALPAPLAMVWLRVLSTVLAGAFTYAFLKVLRLASLPALGGTLVFCFGSLLTAQMHHENVIRSSVWLPAVLACAELSLGATRRRFIGWTAVGALAFSQSALGLHVQPVLMVAIALGGYAVYSGLTRSGVLPLVGAGAMVVGGVAIAAVQWVPLGEWALSSSRRAGVGYEFASAFALAPQNLPSVLFPFFFRLPDATTWWTLWQHWEVELYVGIPTLALMVVGILFSRRMAVLYFVPLGLIALWIGMAEYAPMFNLHQLLWSVPGFSFLRAPGRFSYLVVFACACLTAFGLDVLSARRLRVVVAIVGATPAVALLAALLALLPTWHAYLATDAVRARDVANSVYLAARAQYPIDPELVVDGLLSSLDVSTPKTAWSLALLALTALAFVGWFGLGARRAVVGQAVFVGLIAADLLTFAYDFHPRMPLSSMPPELPPGATAGDRVLLHDSVELPDFEPNQLVGDGVDMAQGYSSLPPQRHVELETATSTQPALFDLWSAAVILEPVAPADARAVNGVSLRDTHPIAAGFGGARPSTFRSPGSAVAVRLIGTLSYAYNVPQGQTVATLTVDGTDYPIRAGIELSERAYDRPSLRGLLQHQKVATAVDFDEATPQGEVYVAHLYEASIPLAPAAADGQLSITPTDPKVLLEIYGIGLVAPDGSVQALDLGDRVGLQRLGPGVLANRSALPRAYVLPRAQAFSPARHPDQTATQLVADPDVDLHRQVLIEGDPAIGPEPVGDRLAAPATVEDLGPNQVRITSTATEPSYVVFNDLYHRGWSAQVDGQPARIYMANALFRAVAVQPGLHVIEFRFQPGSHLIGAVVSGVALLVAVGLSIYGLSERR